MANTDRPNGFRPVGTLAGAPWNANVFAYNVDSSNATAVFKGDAITLEADGNVTPAAAGGIVLGVCVGVKPNPAVAATMHPGYLPASTAGVVYVSVGRDTLYEIQEDGDSSQLALTSVGANVDHIAGSGSTTTGISAHELDSSTLTSAGSAGFRIVGFIDRADNEVGSTGARWLVMLNHGESHWGTTNGI